MTGYGVAKQYFRDGQIQIEIKSVNSRNADIRIRSIFNLRDKEFLIRKEVVDSAIKGKIDINIELCADGLQAGSLVNETLLRGYLKALSPIATEFNLSGDSMMGSILRLPDVLTSGSDSLTDEEWHILESTLDEALDRFLQYRKEEGEAIERDFTQSIDKIDDALNRITEFEPKRLITIKERILNNLNENISPENYDENRFEQELIYYIEKIDFSEEKSRLSQHLKYFIENIDTDVMAKGRTLNFIAQEIGREINTIGSKAYDSDIQRLVVEMKDELEKIKEQTANIV
jgi:uncharacterized protein (TIGR00255 family)